MERLKADCTKFTATGHLSQCAIQRRLAALILQISPVSREME